MRVALQQKTKCQVTLSLCTCRINRLSWSY